MQPINFPQTKDKKLAKSQPQYRPLPVDIIEGEKVRCPACKGAGTNILEASTCDKCKGRGVLQGFNKYIVKYQLSELEKAQVLLTGCIWFQQSGYGFNPILPSLDSPYGAVTVIYADKGEGKFDFWFPYDDEEGNHLQQLIENADPYLYIKSVLDAYPELTPEQLVFAEKSDMAIGPDGEIKTI